MFLSYTTIKQNLNIFICARREVPVNWQSTYHYRRGKFTRSFLLTAYTLLEWKTMCENLDNSFAEKSRQEAEQENSV